MYNVIKHKMDSGLVLIGSDGHYWPGKPSTAHRAFSYFSKMYHPDLVVYNGDAFDGAGISTHPDKGWEDVPSLLQQMNVAKKRMAEIGGKQRVFLLGNHEMRYDKWLVAKAGKFKGLAGMNFASHFPGWHIGERLDIEGKERCIVKHELKGGSNPLKSNLMAAGCHIVTGHHHSQNVLAYTDYSGTRYAVDAGMLAAPGGPQFSYGEGNPTNWRSGCVMLRFFKGKMMPPQLIMVVDEKKGAVWHDGQVWKV